MPGVTIKGLTKRYGDLAALEGLDLRVEAVGLRQDDDAPPGRGVPPARGRRDLGRRSMPLVADQRGPSRAAADGDDLPELRPLAPHDRGAERRLWPSPQAGRAEGGARGACQRDAEGCPAR